ATLPAKPGTRGFVPVVVTNTDGQSATNGNAFAYYPGTIGFLSPKVYPTGSLMFSAATGDLNRDGKVDAVVANSGGTGVAVFLGNGDGTLQPPQAYPTGSGPNGIAVADFNEDGDLDVAAANVNDGTLGVLIGKGDGTFRVVLTTPIGAGPLSV